MELQQHYDEIAQTGAEVIAISTDDLSGAGDIIQQGNINFPILYTSGDSAVPDAYNVFNLFGDGLASASVFIVDKDGNLAYRNIGRNYRHQVAADTVITALQNLG